MSRFSSSRFFRIELGNERFTLSVTIVCLDFTPSLIFRTDGDIYPRLKEMILEFP